MGSFQKAQLMSATLMSRAFFLPIIHPYFRFIITFLSSNKFYNSFPCVEMGGFHNSNSMFFSTKLYLVFLKYSRTIGNSAFSGIFAAKSNM